MEIREAFNYLKFGVAENLLESSKLPGSLISHDSAKKILSFRNRIYKNIVSAALLCIITGVAVYQRNLVAAQTKSNSKLEKKHRSMFKKIVLVGIGVVVGNVAVATFVFNRLTKIQ